MPDIDTIVLCCDGIITELETEHIMSVCSTPSQAGSVESALKVVSDQENINGLCYVCSSFLKNIDSTIDFRDVFNLSSIAHVHFNGEAADFSHIDLDGICSEAQLNDGLNFSISTEGLSSGTLRRVEKHHARSLEIRDAGYKLFDLTSEQHHLLCCSLSRHIEEKYRLITRRCIELNVRPIYGGFSDSVILTIQIVFDDGTNTALVAKISGKELIKMEAQRHMLYVSRYLDSPSNSILGVQFHGDIGILLIPVLTSDDVMEVSLTFDEKFSALRIMEAGCIRYFIKDDEEFEDAQTKLAIAHYTLKKASQTLVGILAKMSSHSLSRIPSDSIPSASLLVGQIEELISLGMIYGLEHEYSYYDYIYHEFCQFEGLAIIHGDFHLNNALFQHQGGASLIDFAACGRGHPAVDLARFEVQVFSKWMVDSSESSLILDLQEALSILVVENEKTPDEILKSLAESYPDAFTTRTNQLCITVAVHCSFRGAEVMRIHGGIANDYFYAKYLVSWQYFVHAEYSPPMLRAVISAMTAMIAESSARLL